MSLFAHPLKLTRLATHEVRSGAELDVQTPPSTQANHCCADRGIDSVTGPAPWGTENGCFAEVPPSRIRGKFKPDFACARKGAGVRGCTELVQCLAPHMDYTWAFSWPVRGDPVVASELDVPAHAAGRPLRGRGGLCVRVAMRGRSGDPLGVTRSLGLASCLIVAVRHARLNDQSLERVAGPVPQFALRVASLRYRDLVQPRPGAQVETRGSFAR